VPDADLGEEAIARQPVVKGYATACAQGKDAQVIGAPFLLVQAIDLLCGSFRNQYACRHWDRLPAITPLSPFLVESEGRTHIASLQLSQAVSQV
jgi:hypothetical protein